MRFSIAFVVEKLTFELLRQTESLHGECLDEPFLQRGSCSGMIVARSADEIRQHVRA